MTDGKSLAWSGPLGPGTMEYVERCLKTRTWVENVVLAQAIRGHEGKPLSSAVTSHLADRLEEKVKPPRGRKPGGDVRTLRNLLITLLYRDYLKQLLKHDLQKGEPFERRWLRKCDWWKGPPNERAAHMTVKRLCGKEPKGLGFPMVSWREVKNIAKVLQ